MEPPNERLSRDTQAATAAVSTFARFRALFWSWFCFFVLPGALTALFCSRWLPSPFAVVDGIPRLLARSLFSNPLLLCVSLFLCFFGLLRYWRHQLPGFAWTLPLRLDSREKRSSRILRALESVLARHQTGLWQSHDPALLQELQATIDSGNLQSLAQRAEGVRETSRAHGPRMRWKVLAWISLPLLSAAIVRLFVVQSYAVTGNSMLPTFESGDELGARPTAYRLADMADTQFHTNQPRRGDIVALDNPTSQGEAKIIKRVIGLPGDQISAPHGTLEINGWRVPVCDAGIYANITGDFEPVQGRVLVEFLGDREYLTLYESTKPAVAAPSYTVRPSEVFVLGDNRNSSLDSRSLGAVPLSRIRGRIDWFLVGTHPNGTADFSRFLRPMKTQPHLAGIDSSEMLRRINECIAHRPRETWPPSSNGQALMARASVSD